MAYRLYIRMRITNMAVEEQIQQILSYVQKVSVDIQKENIIENLKSRSLSYVMSRSLTIDLIFIFISYFIFIFLFFSFFFYFQNNSGQGLSVTPSHQSQSDGIVTRLITGYKRRKQKVLEQSDVIQHGQHMLASCYTHGYLGQGAQQLAWTMGTSI